MIIYYENTFYLTKSEKMPFSSGAKATRKFYSISGYKTYRRETLDFQHREILSNTSCIQMQRLFGKLFLLRRLLKLLRRFPIQDLRMCLVKMPIKELHLVSLQEYCFFTINTSLNEFKISSMCFHRHLQKLTMNVLKYYPSPTDNYALI